MLQMRMERKVALTTVTLMTRPVDMTHPSHQGEYTGGQAKEWIYPSSVTLQPITAKHIKQQPIL